MMKAGKYYVGDLCYVMHPEWDELCDLFFAGRADHGCNQGEFTLKDGRQIASFNTSWGDGTYESNVGTTHCVDSGSIGCIRVEDIRDNTYDKIESLGAIVDFEDDFEVYSKNGVIVIGHVRIDTEWTDEEEEDYYEDDEE